MPEYKPHVRAAAGEVQKLYDLAGQAEEIERRLGLLFPDEIGARDELIGMYDAIGVRLEAAIDATQEHLYQFGREWSEQGGRTRSRANSENAQARIDARTRGPDSGGRELMAALDPRTRPAKRHSPDIDAELGLIDAEIAQLDQNRRPSGLVWADVQSNMRLAHPAVFKGKWEAHTTSRSDGTEVMRWEAPKKDKSNGFAQLGVEVASHVGAKGEAYVQLWKVLGDKEHYVTVHRKNNETGKWDQVGRSHLDYSRARAAAEAYAFAHANVGETGDLSLEASPKLQWLQERKGVETADSPLTGKTYTIEVTQRGRGPWRARYGDQWLDKQGEIVGKPAPMRHSGMAQIAAQKHLDRARVAAEPFRY
jgi:hypothetical protein